MNPDKRMRAIFAAMAGKRKAIYDKRNAMVIDESEWSSWLAEGTGKSRITVSEREEIEPVSYGPRPMRMPRTPAVAKPKISKGAITTGDKYWKDVDFTSLTEAGQIKLLTSAANDLNKKLFGGSLNFEHGRIGFLKHPVPSHLGAYLHWELGVLVNQNFFNKNTNKGQLYETFVHELCHKAQYEVDKITWGDAHGKPWRDWMYHVGIDPDRLHQFPHDLTPKSGSTRIGRQAGGRFLSRLSAYRTPRRRSSSISFLIPE